jgi:hypothetical protein
VRRFPGYVSKEKGMGKLVNEDDSVPGRGGIGELTEPAWTKDSSQQTKICSRLQNL